MIQNGQNILKISYQGRSLLRITPRGPWCPPGRSGLVLAIVGAKNKRPAKWIAGRQAALPQNCLTTEEDSRPVLAWRPRHFGNPKGNGQEEVSIRLDW